MVSGATDDLTRASVSAVLILVFAVALLALARGWFRADDWPKTPTVLWNALLLPVGRWVEGDRGQIALAVGAVAPASIVAAVAAPRRQVARPRPLLRGADAAQLIESQSFQPLCSTSHATRP